MNRKKKELPVLENVTIEDVAAEGNAIARVEDMVVFVPYAVPGDVVDLQVTRKRHSFMEARVIRFRTYSQRRARPFCSHYGTCGGCVWQILPYEDQLSYKQKQVRDNLSRIGKVILPEISPILGSQETMYYRNKLEFTFSNRRFLTREQISSGEAFEGNVLGFHVGGCFDKVLPVDACYLQSPLSDAIRNTVRDLALEMGLSFHDLRSHEGMMRNMVIRTASTGQVMVILVAQIHEQAQMDAFLALLARVRDRFPEITSLQYVINNKLNDSIQDLQVHLFSGQDHIMERMEDLSFKVGPKSFYQTNSRQAYRLYSVVRDMARLTGSELVYDLYTGTGTIANFVARSARRVIGIEYVREAIEDARVNAQVNGIHNTDFFDGDMKDILNGAFIAQHGRPDVIITDPPRAGMHPDVIGVILKALPGRIVYVSCNPSTQARDLQMLDGSYEVLRVQPVDMFPQTHHVENVVLLGLRSQPLAEPQEAQEQDI